MNQKTDVVSTPKTPARTSQEQPRGPHGALTLDELFAQRDQRATEPMPPRTDIREYVFEGNPGSAVACETHGSVVRIRAAGELTQRLPVALDGERLSIDQLRQLSDGVRRPEAYRPPWLDLAVSPRLRPRHLDVRVPGGLRPLIYESTGTDWPWSAMGKVFITRPGQPTKVGSGVLVGPRLLLTASHAMPWGRGDASIRFAPGYRHENDPRFGDAYVESWRGVRNDDDVTGLDYVICKLNWRIADRTGWLGTEWHSDDGWYFDAPWLSLGYPSSGPGGGEVPSMELPVWVQDIDNDFDGLEIETHLFAMGGWSGGPLWGWRGGQPVVVGIESGFEKDGLDPTRTVFAGGEHLVNLAKYGWANWS